MSFRSGSDITLASSPTTCKVPRTTIFSFQMNNLINLSHCKQEIRHHPRLFLSDDDDSVGLPDQHRPAPPIDFIPPYTEGQPLSPYFPGYISIPSSDMFHQIHLNAETLAILEGSR